MFFIFKKLSIISIGFVDFIVIDFISFSSFYLCGEYSSIYGGWMSVRPAEWIKQSDLF